MSSFHLPALSYAPKGGPLPSTGVPDTKSQETAELNSEARPRPAKAKASVKASKAPVPPVEQSLAAQRAKSVYQIMERLLEETIADPRHLQSLVHPLSGEEYLQVAEERHLAGMCGNAACPNERPLATGRGRLLCENETGFCSSTCELAARRLAGGLGTVEAAMNRFAAGSEKPATPKKQESKAGTYAAGAADNPIMLARVKEKDPAVLQAEAQMRAALAKDTSAALAAGSGPSAVEGYVPRNSPGGATAATAIPASSSTAADAAASGTSPHRSAKPSSVQSISTARSAEPHRARVSELPQAALAASKQSIEGASLSAARASPSQADTDVQQVMAGPGCRSSHFSEDVDLPALASRENASLDEEPDRYGATEEAGRNLQQPAESSQGSALAGSAARVGGETEGAAAEDGARAPVEMSQQPVLVFEVDDPEGPLDPPGEDIGQQFGRLQLKTAAELGLPAQQLSELAAAQKYTPQPTLAQDLEVWKRHVGITQGNGHGTDNVPAASSEVQERIVPDLAPAPELPEEDAASEADPESDEETALQWLSEPPPGFGRHLSGFGQLFTLLEGLVTERCAKLLRGSDSTGSGGLPMHSSLQAQAALEGAIERVLGEVLKAMRVPALRSAVEQHLHRLAGSFNYTSAIPTLQGADWQMLTVVMLKALSLEQLPALQEMFDSRTGAKNIDSYVSSIGYSMEELWSLLDLLLN